MEHVGKKKKNTHGRNINVSAKIQIKTFILGSFSPARLHARERLTSLSHDRNEDKSAQIISLSTIWKK